MRVSKNPIILQWQLLHPPLKPVLTQPRCWKAEHTVVPIRPMRATKLRAPRCRFLGSKKRGKNSSYWGRTTITMLSTSTSHSIKALGAAR